MNILSIETSCDETGVSLVNCTLKDDTYTFNVKADNLLSQAKLHAEYGGVFPSLAKREHAKAIIPLIKKTLTEAGINTVTSPQKTGSVESASLLETAKVLLEREPETAEELSSLLNIDVDQIDAIAITVGPGLAPALWVGVNTARALATIWNKPLIPVNHMHGHIFSALFPQKKMYELPALTLLVSGGHTEILSLDKNLELRFLGGTRDDAIGEAFDKAARVLDLGYPGGPLISRLAEEAREKSITCETKLPRPMISDDSYDVSYSGLKTALLYLHRDNPAQSKDEVHALAREFEDAALDVILSKTQKALETGEFKSLVVGGGVIANNELRRRLADLSEEFSLPLYLPEQRLTTDNSLMIAVAAFIATNNGKTKLSDPTSVSANANLDSYFYIK